MYDYGKNVNGVSVCPNFRIDVLRYAFFGNDNSLFSWNIGELEHDFIHQFFQNGSDAAGSCFAFQGCFGNGLNCFRAKIQIGVVKFEHFRELF